jgi:hypothetical protein
MTDFSDSQISDSPRNGQSDELCPFDFHRLVWYDGVLTCDECDCRWHEEDELVADRESMEADNAR